MNIDWPTVEAMAQRFSPADEIVNALGLTPKQFKRAVYVNYKKSVEQFIEMCRARGRYQIRQAQYDEALKGHGPLLRWVGIQELGQRQKVDILQKGEGGEKEPEEDRTKGFKVFTPEALEVKKAVEPAKQPHDETPAVEEIIKQEQAVAPKVTNAPRTEIVVSGFPEEHEA